MGLCESSNNQAAANQATTAVTNAATTANTMTVFRSVSFPSPA